MPRFVYSTATTIDGFLATDDDSLDWLFAVPGAAEAEAGIDDFLARVGALVMGSTTYEWVLGHEAVVEHPERWAQFYGDRPVWVFTSRDLAVVAGADIRLRRGGVAEHVDEIAASAGDGDVWIVGGGDLAGQFATAGHLDELLLDVAPVTLGAGRPLLPRFLDSSRLHLVSAEQREQFAHLVYRVGRP